MTTAARWTRRVLATVCVMGTVTFSAAFLATFVARPTIEREAREYLVGKVEREARVYLGGVLARHAPLQENASVLKQQLDGDIAAAQALMESRLPEIVGELIAELYPAGRERVGERAEATYANVMRNVAKRAIGRATDKLAGLKAFVTGKYQAMLANLLREVRLFTAINAALFACTSAVLWWRRRAMQPVVVPIALLTVASCISIWLYLGKQNWLWTVLLNDYVGWWYLSWVAIIGGLLTDIVLNQARITSAFVSGLPGAFVPRC